ncbi:fructose bisphosphate aldolase [Lachnospiraceae bacterium OttesenSCG-928-J05]|nr:fructose bisphosphate aldolase [Lachnospiraceae bacterium OttesenSCG-928-J05]
MNEKQLERMEHGPGFIAALDQSGGSTPKALAGYGIDGTAYQTEDEMFDLIHQMRTRIIKSPAFTSEHILGAILFEMTMNRKIDDLYTADYLWEKKGIVPFLKVDQGLADLENGVQLMKPLTKLDDLLKTANERHIFGTKMRSVIKEANPEGIKNLIAQQFEVGKRIAAAGLVPILEPEVDIHAPEKERCEELLLAACWEELKGLDATTKIMFKLTIPSQDNYYQVLMDDPHVVRVVALSGGYSRTEADEKLARNTGLIASFSRALLNDLKVSETDDEFDHTLAEAIKEIYDASIS